MHQDEGDKELMVNLAMYVQGNYEVLKTQEKCWSTK